MKREIDYSQSEYQGSSRQGSRPTVDRRFMESTPNSALKQGGILMRRTHWTLRMFLAAIVSLGHLTPQRAAASTGSSGRSAVDLSMEGWKAWLDEKAAWKADTLYAAGDLPALDQLPVNPPTGGWKVLDGVGRPVALPATIEEYFSGGVNTWTYHGVSWFWRDVEIPADWRGKVVRLEVAKARMRVEIYVNSRLAACDTVAETPFEVNLGGFLKFGARNRIAVRLTNPGGNRGWNDTVGKRWGKYQLPVMHDFSVLGEMKLVASAPVYVADVFVKNLPPAGARNIEVEVTVANTDGSKHSKTLSVTVPGTGAVATREVELKPGDNRVAIPMTVAGARLWDVDSPNLYDCCVTLEASDDRVEDRYTQQFGFRVFEVKEGGSGGHNFYLNGLRFRHRSALDWSYYSLSGAYATPGMARRSVEAVKLLGQNGINFHRQIGEPLVFGYADALGVCILEEPGAFHGLARADDFAGKNILEKIRRMVVRDRNHPSLIIYNLSNEDNGWNPLRERAMRLVAGLDGTRLVVNTSGDQYHPEGAKAGETMSPPGRVPHMRPYAAELRADHGDPHNEPNTKARYLEGSFFDKANRQEIAAGTYYLGEVLAPTGPANWVKGYEMRAQFPGRAGSDLNIYRENHDKLVKAFADWRMDRFGNPAIRTPADISTQAARGMMYIQGRDAQSILCNNSADGFALNGWTSGPQTEGDGLDWDSAMLDEARNLKGPAEDFTYWSRPLQVALVRANGKYFSPGQTAAFAVHLVNENRLPAGSYTLCLTVSDGLGRETEFREERSVQVAGRECYAQEIGTVQVPMKEGWHGGYITVKARLQQEGRTVADGAEQVLLQNRRSFAGDVERSKIAIVNWPAAVVALKDAGVPALAPPPQADVILAGQPDANVESLLECARKGAAVIVKFDRAWADCLYEKGILKEKVKEWGGQQNGFWAGNGWGYLSHFIGDQALPGKTTIGTTSWDVPENPVGFYPFASDYGLAVYGLHVARPWTAVIPPEKSKYKEDAMPGVSVLLGAVDYGMGKLILAPSYAVDANNGFNDLLFFTLVKKAGQKEW